MKIGALLAITFSILSSAALQAAEIPNWGTITSPLGDCKFSQDKGRLEIAVPGTEKAHGLTAELQSMDAPRMLRPVKGDLTIQVKVDGLLDPGQEATEPNRTPYKAAGLVAMFDEQNYVTLVRAALQRGQVARAYANFEMRVNGQCTQVGDARVRPLQLDQPAYLRLSRQGNQFLGWVSDDGENWEALQSKEAPSEWASDLHAGIVAISNARSEFAAGFADLKLNGTSAGSRASVENAPVNPFNRYLPSNDDADCAECKANLEKINAAIQAYRKEHKDIPNWLSDLVPTYLPDSAVFICPVTKKTDRLSPFGAPDPKIRCSYLYEFAPTPMTAVVKKAFTGPTLTNRDWKRQQMGIVGSDVPIVRCLLHSPVLNLSFGGKVYESPMFWEQNFLNVTTMEALSPR